MKLLKKVFTRPCPNCESAWTGGAPNPEDIDWCFICSSPRSGKLRGWVWRWSWFQRTFVVAKNYAFFNRVMVVVRDNLAGWIPDAMTAPGKCTHPLTRLYGDSRCPDCDDYIGS